MCSRLEEPNPYRGSEVRLLEACSPRMPFSSYAPGPGDAADAPSARETRPNRSSEPNPYLAPARPPGEAYMAAGPGELRPKEVEQCAWEM